MTRARSLDEQVRAVYTPGREPDGYLRHAEARGEVQNDGRTRRRQRCCEQCGAVYGSRAHQGKRFCSRACYDASPRPPRPPRPPHPKVIPSVEQVRAEMVEALARFEAVVNR